MSLIRFNRRSPWFSSELSDFFDKENFFRDDFFNRAFENKPALNIKETDTDYEIELAAPGLSREDFEVSIEDGYLNVSAEKTLTDEQKEDNYIRKDFSYNSFKRTLLLPDNVKQDDIKASYDNGVLRMKLFKKSTEVSQPSKTIEVS
ncbi:Hsp20/alpha crystallin family protein [Ascidiimonas aurantiaca]|uniref:Hsp20/alpha crystallin family protein n=1 Tax=Ascidiimonas aurantiaca TaxID=1685432 RepID=UPI0030EBF6F8